MQYRFSNVFFFCCCCCRCLGFKFNWICKQFTFVVVVHYSYFLHSLVGKIFQTLFHCCWYLFACMVDCCCLNCELNSLCGNSFFIFFLRECSFPVHLWTIVLCGFYAAGDGRKWNNNKSLNRSLFAVYNWIMIQQRKIYERGGSCGNNWVNLICWPEFIESFNCR